MRRATAAIVITAFCLTGVVATASAAPGDPAVADAPGAIDSSDFCHAQALPRNDDQSTGRIDLPFAVNFFGNTHNSLYVNNNGNVTFDRALPTYTPFALTTNIYTAMIAPFFADIDTRDPGSAEVTYGASPDGRTFCVNWAGVGYFRSHSDKLIYAQLQLIDRSGSSGNAPGDFDLVMNYGSVQWETGDASGGAGGVGGSSARAGYSAGTGADGTYFEFPGSGVNGAFLDGSGTALNTSRRNSTVDGRNVFPVRSGAVPVGAGVSGTVYAGSVAPEHALGDAFVQVCPEVAGRGCNTSSTNDAGQYQVSGLPDGSYTVTAYPPGSSSARPGSRAVIIAGGVSMPGQDVVLDVPAGIPAGTTLTSIRTSPAGIPTVYWGDSLTLTTHGCAGAAASFTVTQGSLTLRSGPMAEGPAGEYSATITPLRPISGYARITITLNCPGGSPATTVFDVYIDPSGTVVNTLDHPIPGATVTLFRSDGPDGPFTQVPDGSGLMSPANRINPSLTAADGHFGWDVVAGYYRVQATAPGCTSAIDPAQDFAQTAVLTIPPPAIDLKLVLACANHVPAAAFSTTTSSGDAPLAVAFDASGSMDVEGIASYAWAFGDGATGTGVSVNHTYSAPGTYPVVLTVTDTDGATATATATITVTSGSGGSTGQYDVLSMDRAGSMIYQFGGELVKGDFVVKRKRKGTVVTAISGLGLVDGRWVKVKLSVADGQATGIIEVRNLTNRTVLDRIPVWGTLLDIHGDVISGVTTWSSDAGVAERLAWSITDTF